MKYLRSITVDPCSLSDPPAVVARWGPIPLLRYLKLKQSLTVPWNSLRVIFVGPQGSGKTSLSAKLRGEGMSSTCIPTKGLEVR